MAGRPTVRFNPSQCGAASAQCNNSLNYVDGYRNQSSIDFILCWFGVFYSHQIPFHRPLEYDPSLIEQVQKDNASKAGSYQSVGLKFQLGLEDGT